MNEEVKKQTGPEKEGWGIEKMPYPKGVAYISARWDLCVGCGACELACSMYHYGEINRELSRIRIFRYMLPLPKSVQNVCAQCSEQERECQKACPEDPPVIRYDEELKHMVVDEDRCLGSGCGQCLDACQADVPRFYPPENDFSMVCDLCEKDGKRTPQCVEICPTQALEFVDAAIPRHFERIHPDVKAESLSKRLYPLPVDRVFKLPEEIWGGK